MPIGEIKDRFFLSPREAIDEIVGPATHGDAWQKQLPAGNDLVKIALRNLYTVLQGGKITAYHHAFDGHERQLTAIEAANEFFKIDLDRNCCLFGPIEGPPRELKISRADLVAFLDSAQSADEAQPPSDLEQCTCWLIERLSTTGRRPLNKELEPEALQRWPKLSKRQYKNARGNARARMGKAATDFSGRPRLEKPAHSG